MTFPSSPRVDVQHDCRSRIRHCLELLRPHRRIYWAAALWYVLAVVFMLQMSGTLQLVLLIATAALVFAFIASLLVVVRNARTIASYLPLACCGLAVVAMPSTVRTLEPAVFEMKRAALQALLVRNDVVSLRAGTSAILPLSSNERDFAYLVLAERMPDGTLLLSVATEGAFPVRHAGYVYSSSGSTDYRSEALGDWQALRPIFPNWFRAYD